MNPEVWDALGSALSSAIPELAQLASVSGVLSIILEGFMSVVGKLMTGPLRTVIAWIQQLGIVLGTILAPWIQVVSDLFGVLAKGLLWFYNEVLRRIGNIIIFIFKVVQQTVWMFVEIIVRVINVVIRMINLLRRESREIAEIANPVAPVDLSTGWLEPIDMPGLAGDEDGTPSDAVGATYQQQRPIIVTVNVYDNQVFGGSLQQFGLLIRDELLAIDELGL